MAKQNKKPPESIPELVSALEGLKKGSKFAAFIDSLRLYAFKNVRDSTRIDFDFPVTALVGANGCGKSSVLQALFGCPKGYSLGKYWFSTTLDPISDENGARPSLVYTYADQAGKLREVVKSRIKWNKKEGASQNFDYWEPSRPLKKLDMTLLPDKSRHPTISMDVVVIDFRYQLSAFDRYFYLEEVDYYNQRKRRNKQDVIRLRSEKILTALNPESVTNKTHEKVHILSEEECSILSKILGKRYQGGKILHHRFHGFWAHTVIFEVASTISPHRYTEANAGSGEVAVALLVHKLRQVKNGSLVLLDEPEYSLHPGAQREVLRYLLDQSLQKQLQIVFTTHAPTMIEGLPLGAVKVFALDPATEKFIVHQDRSAEEAFLSIGHRVTNKLAIRVEDRLAKALIEEAMKKMCADERLPHEFPALVDVVFYPGGVGSMKNDIIRYSREADINVRQIFDGSERPKETIELQKLTTEENQPSSLKQRLEQVVGQKITFAIDGGKGGGRADQELAAIHSYIRFWNERCFFLPFDVPEEVLWDRDLAKAQLEPVLSSPAELELELDRLDGCVGKVRFQELAKTLYNENASAQILAIQTYFLKAWLNRGEAAEIKQVEEIILKIRELVGFINGKSCSVES